jgi:hypothetical protein
MRDHSALVAVQRDARVVERLLRVLQVVVEFRDAALEYAPKVARNQRPPYRYTPKQRHSQDTVRTQSDMSNVHGLQLIDCIFSLNSHLIR